MTKKIIEQSKTLTIFEGKLLKVNKVVDIREFNTTVIHVSFGYILLIEFN